MIAAICSAHHGRPDRLHNRSALARACAGTSSVIETSDNTITSSPTVTASSFTRWVAMESDPILEPLNHLVGTWTTEATHPAMPGVVVHGTVNVEWLDGERFLLHRASSDHPDFPDSISIIGMTGQDRVDPSRGDIPRAPADSRLRMHYYDSRGVFREYLVSIDETSWHIWRHAPGFSQRFTGTVADGGDTIVGRWQLSRDDRHWDDDLTITYRRGA